MNRAEFQAVQYKYRLYEAKRDSTPNEWSPSREVYVKHGNKEKLLIISFSLFICKLFIWKKLVINQNLNRKVVFILLKETPTTVLKYIFRALTKTSNRVEKKLTNSTY